WQEGLGDKLGLCEIFGGPNGSKYDRSKDGFKEGDLDLASMSTTWTSELREPAPSSTTTGSKLHDSQTLNPNTPPTPHGKVSIPPMLAYVHPSQPSTPLIRRIDTAKLLL